MDNSIASLIRGRARFVLMACSLMQVVLVVIVMGYLGIRDATNRASFLAQSSNSLLGLMIATGDFFQLKNVVKSFKNDATPSAFILDEDGKSILEDVDDETYVSSSGGNVSFSRTKWLILTTSHDVIYAGNKVGTLVLENRIKLTDWLLICGIIAITALSTFIFQSHTLRSQALKIGSSLSSLTNFFNHAQDEVTLDRYYSNRAPANISEVDLLARNIFVMLTKIIKAGKIQKEAAVGRIVSQVSHDMRAPLGVFESILDAPPEKVPSLYGSVREALYRLNSMIESLRHSDTESLIKKAATQVEYKGLVEGFQNKAKARNISIEMIESWQSEIFVDPPKFERALVNLVSNAIDAASSYVKISLTANGTDLVLRVCDDGPGVPNDFMPRLFQRGATHGKHDGTGLGLAYVRQIMQGHGGDVVYLPENGLTIFECRLPNAIIGKEEKTVELSLLTEMSLDQVAPKLVSICVEPPSVAKEVLAALASRISSKFTYNETYSPGKTDIIVTNNPEVAARILEEDADVEIAEYQPTLPHELLKARLLRRFGS